MTKLMLAVHERTSHRSCSALICDGCLPRSAPLLCRSTSTTRPSPRRCACMARNHSRRCCRCGLTGRRRRSSTRSPRQSGRSRMPPGHRGRSARSATGSRRGAGSGAIMSPRCCGGRRTCLVRTTSTIGCSTTPVAIRTQNTEAYVQNIVEEVLTDGSPEVAGIVEEHFPMAAMTDPHVFYGSGGDAGPAEEPRRIHRADGQRRPVRRCGRRRSHAQQSVLLGSNGGRVIARDERSISRPYGTKTARPWTRP